MIGTSIFVKLFIGILRMKNKRRWVEYLKLMRVISDLLGLKEKGDDELAAKQSYSDF